MPSPEPDWDTIAGQEIEARRDAEAADAGPAASMLAEERTLVYGRGTTGNGYVGALAAAPTPVLTAVSASVGAAYNATALVPGNYAVVVTADAGQLGPNHEGTATAAASVNAPPKPSMA